MSFRVSSITGHLHKAAFVFLFFAVSGIAAAQTTLSQNQDGFSGARMDGFMDSGPDKDSTVVERTVSQDYNQWVIDPVSGLQHAVIPDTLHHSFHNVHLTEGMSGSYSYLGNMGSPRLSRLFFERRETSDFMFDAPYDFWIRKPLEFRFTDTKTPHLNLDYYKGGDKRTGEERLKGYFAANFNYRTGIGIDMDYLIGRGRYTNQSTSMFDARLYTYYRGDSYTMHVSASRDNMKIAENGGIQDIRYITNPESMAEGRKQYAPEDIPFRIYDNWKTVSGTSPVPGGMSTTRQSISFHITSVQNCFTTPAITGPLHTTGSDSFSSRRFIDMISIPILVFAGIIPNSQASAF